MFSMYDMHSITVWFFLYRMCVCTKYLALITKYIDYD